MDRIPDSGSDDASSILAGCTFNATEKPIWIDIWAFLLITFIDNQQNPESNQNVCKRSINVVPDR